MISVLPLGAARPAGLHGGETCFDFFFSPAMEKVSCLVLSRPLRMAGQYSCSVHVSLAIRASDYAASPAQRNQSIERHRSVSHERRKGFASLFFLVPLPVLVLIPCADVDVDVMLRLTSVRRV